MYYYKCCWHGGWIFEDQMGQRRKKRGLTKESEENLKYGL
jgi:hypothetical protein